MTAMHKNIEIVDIRNFILSHPTRSSGQYAVQLTMDNGDVSIQRLKGCFPSPGVLKMMEEPQQKQNLIHLAAGNVIQRLHDPNNIKASRGCKFKTCREAMLVFEKECNRDSHGNSFKEFFADQPLVYVPRQVPDYVEWLLEKYCRVEQTVCKKVFAASSLFKWLKRTGQWEGPNPFHGALEGVRFAPKRKNKSIIEPAELERLNAVMNPQRHWGRGYMPDWLKELRVMTGIMFFTGTRPSEATEMVGENIDAGLLTLTYQRTKRKNKTPDWRTIPIPNQLITFLAAEERTSGRLVHTQKRSLESNMKKAREIAGVPGLYLKTFRKDFAFRARQTGASRDDVNLYQGRDESILEHHYTTDEWFIVHQCRWWIEKMFAEPDNSPLRLVK